jgi:DNA-binding beta-propeller fold protein YncE
MSSRTWAYIGIGLGTLLAAGTAVALQPPSYPKVNAANVFEADMRWPEKPADFKWVEFHGVAVDPKDNVYCFTRGTPPVQVYTSEGKFVRAWGEGLFKAAHSIKADSEGNVWVTDIEHQTVRKFSPEGKLLLTLGTPEKAGRDKSHFNLPTDMFVTPKGDIFVCDGYGNARVVHFDKDGNYLNEWGELGSKPGQFSVPHSVCVDSKGRVYIADRNNVRIQVFDQSGKLLDVWNDLIVPMSLAITKDDEIWVVGSSPQHWKPKEVWLGSPPRDQYFMKFNTTGKALAMWGATMWPADKIGDNERPGVDFKYHQLAVDSKGCLYGADLPGKKVQKFVPVKGDVR